MTGEIDNLPGSQYPTNSEWHAMMYPEWTPEHAEKLFNQYVDINFNSCTKEGLARALHAVQDSYAPGHENFAPWHGTANATFPQWVKIIIDHAWYDNGSYFTRDVRNITKNMIKKWSKQCECQ
uniref:hypothetical protein n=1 Tax=Marinobacterium profundum TaxID=1714300 RepID=UPI00131533E3|nr:hypothetical protein [Marinobacterium profundum]